MRGSPWRVQCLQLPQTRLPSPASGGGEARGRRSRWVVFMSRRLRARGGRAKAEEVPVGSKKPRTGRGCERGCRVGYQSAFVFSLPIAARRLSANLSSAGCTSSISSSLTWKSPLIELFLDGGKYLLRFKNVTFIFWSTRQHQHCYNYHQLLHVALRRFNYG